MRRFTMYSLGLVQNQSEMAHYGYADARAFIEELSYKVTLFTAENIDTLASALSRGTVDALVLGSNALNDKTIRGAFATTVVRDAMQQFLHQGRGLVVFHQLRLASTVGAHLDFLPPELAVVRPVVRPTTETSSSGTLAIPLATSGHVTLQYPTRLVISQLQDQALSFRSLKGVYWHWWAEPNLADWDILITDGAESSERPLLLSTKETSPYRVVLSALTLDWQRQREALQNLLAYVVEGRHNTAILTSDQTGSATFAYFLATLEAQKFPFQRYAVNSNLASLREYLAASVHTTLVLGEGITLDALPNALKAQVSLLVEAGDLKLVTLDRNPGALATFSIASRESYARRLLALAELAVQAELRGGNIDGSFWSTAETLQVLENLPTKQADYEGVVGEALRLAAEHDRNGSYDEVFGVTCALYWLRARYLGTTSAAARTTEAWLLDNVAQYDDREQALAYTTFASLGTLTDAGRSALGAILEGLTWKGLSEIDLVTYLRAALVARLPRTIPSIVAALEAKQVDGAWIDLATTASAASALLDAQELVRADPTIAPQRLPGVDHLIRRAVIYIQDSLPAGSQHAFPWEGKASTTVRCLEAWLKFDRGVDLPVYDVVDHLQGADLVARELASTRTSLAVLEQLKSENDALTARVDDLAPRVEAADREFRRRRLLSIATGLMCYVLAVTLIASIGMDEAGFRPLMERAFVTPANVHIGLAAAVAAVLLIPWQRFLRRIDKAKPRG